MSGKVTGLLAEIFFWPPHHQALTNVCSHSVGTCFAICELLRYTLWISIWCECLGLCVSIGTMLALSQVGILVMMVVA